MVDMTRALVNVELGLFGAALRMVAFFFRIAPSALPDALGWFNMLAPQAPFVLVLLSLSTIVFPMIFVFGVFGQGSW